MPPGFGLAACAAVGLAAAVVGAATAAVVGCAADAAVGRVGLVVLGTAWHAASKDIAAHAPASLRKPLRLLSFRCIATYSYPSGQNPGRSNIPAPCSVHQFSGTGAERVRRRRSQWLRRYPQGVLVALDKHGSCRSAIAAGADRRPRICWVFQRQSVRIFDG